MPWQGSRSHQQGSRWSAMARIAVLVMAVIAASGWAMASSSARSEAARSSGGTTPQTVRRVILLVGDSVPQQMWRAFKDAARPYGYRVTTAAEGGCPAIGELVVQDDGTLFGGREACARVVRQRQDVHVDRDRPALVLWWSRYEVADRVGADGRLLRAGAPGYWEAQEAAFQARIKALTRLGARVVAIQIERPGIGGCPNGPCGPYRRRLVYQTWLVGRWNAFLAAHHGPRVFSISIDSLVCHDRRSPCDDRLPSGRPARPDGIHYEPPAKAPLARRIVAEAMVASGLARQGFGVP